MVLIGMQLQIIICFQPQGPNFKFAGQCSSSCCKVGVFKVDRGAYTVSVALGSEAAGIEGHVTLRKY